jgi:hypothetical protein
MTHQLPLDFPKINGNGSGKSGRPRERDLAADLKRWLRDLDATEALRREQLAQVRTLRLEIYKLAKARGVSAAWLRVARKLMRKR